MAIRVLICDDAPELIGLYKLWFSHEADIDLVGEARDGAEAVRMTDSLLPDVVLLDIQMPKKDGIEALTQITRAHPETKVIMLTGVDGGGFAERAVELGAADYIQKGMDLGQVTDRIRAAAGPESMM